MQKYNYVIYQTPNDYYRISYSDLTNREDVLYIDDCLSKKNKFVKTLNRIHHSKKVNSLFKLPYKKKWYPYYFNNIFSTEHPLCFIFNARWLQYPHIRGYVIFLKNQYKDAKFICFYQDLVSSHIGAKPSSISHLFDMLLSYDKNDVEKYSLIYHPTVFSNYHVSVDYSIPKSDVYFVGLVKNRYKLLLKLYDQLTNEGIVCDFYLSGVPISQQIEADGITYIDRMTYIENLKHVILTNCILEIIQNEADGSTLRTWEAIMYDKKLATNNFSLSNSIYYNCKYISFIKENVLDINFLKEENPFINPYKDLISPNRLLDFICHRL